CGGGSRGALRAALRLRRVRGGQGRAPRRGAAAQAREIPRSRDRCHAQGRARQGSRHVLRREPALPLGDRGGGRQHALRGGVPRRRAATAPVAHPEPFAGACDGGLGGGARADPAGDPRGGSGALGGAHGGPRAYRIRTAREKPSQGNDTMKLISVAARAAAIASFACAATAALAQAYPARTVKIIAPVQPGGGVDLVARTMADRFTKELGQTFIVENQSGGGGAIASQTVARAAPDGYTLMLGYVGTHGTNPAVRKLPYDAVRDFTPIAMVGGTPNVLVVNPSVPAKTLQEVIDHTKKTQTSYGSAGTGTLTHLAMEQLKQAAGFDSVHVPYRGIGPALTDTIGGQTQMMMPGLAAALPHIKAGKVRPIAVTGLKRHPLLPDVPTFE